MIISNLSFALQCADIKYSFSDIENEYNEIQSLDDILKYNASKNRLLWNWLPAIVYEKFGLELYLSNFCKISTTDSYVMLHPSFEDKKENLICALQCLEVEISEMTLFFSLPNISKIYGGFPWFRSYIKLCNELKCFGKTTSVFHVKCAKNDATIDMIEMIRKWKNEYRDVLAPKIFRVFANEDFPGIVNTFHSPTYIEQERFSLLLTK